MTKVDNDNHANQMNPNNDAYWQSRRDDERPGEHDGSDSEPDERDQGDRVSIFRSTTRQANQGANAKN
jgi:hypothetical protein